MLNKLQKLIIIGFVGVLLLSTPIAKGQDVTFSKDLAVGHTFSWLIGLQGDEIDFLANGDIVQIEVVKDPGVYGGYEEYFEITRNEEPLVFDYDDPLLWFISPTETEEGNPTEDQWICMIIDDFCFQDIPFSVSLDGDIAKYSGDLTYEDGDRTTFEGEVNTKYGITVGMRIEVFVDGTKMDVFTVDNTQSSVDLGVDNTEAQLGLDWKFLIFGVTFVVLIKRKRRKLN